MRITLVFVSVCLLFPALVLPGCKYRFNRQESVVSTPAADQESMIRNNQSMVRKNAETIRELALSKGWKLDGTGTGVFYEVLDTRHRDSDRKIEPGDRVSLEYRISLIDGTECYSSETLGLKQFAVEKTQAEAGLHDAVQFLYPGDSARIIIPPHRGFGLTGDGDKIPPQAILVYEIRVDSVSRHLIY